MQKWIILDYETRCYNLLVKLNRANIEKPYLTIREIRAKTKEIAKTYQCDKLTALKRYKSQLFKELVVHKKSDGTETVKGENNA